MIAPPSTLAAPPSITLERSPEPSKRYGYDAAESTNRRKTAKVYRGNEDSILGGQKRDQAQANTRDICRNFSSAWWAIRRHLDYVTDFKVEVRTEDQGLRKALLQWEANWSEPENFDASERFDRENFIRLVEAMSIIDGDDGIVKMADGRATFLESDRVRNKNGQASEADDKGRGTWWHGILTDKVGRHVAYRVHSRLPSGGFQFEREIPAANVIWHAQLSRYDQVRGVAPLASGANLLRDVHENVDHANVKSKVANIFGIQILREAEASLLPATPAPGEGDETTGDEKGYEINFGRGPFMLDLDPGERGEILESHTPSMEFQAYMTQVMMLALKALDIPFSFFNESFTNFFGSRAAWLHYEKACKPKRRKIRRILRKLSAWRLAIAIEDGEFDMPSSMTFEELVAAINWYPSGTPWWKPSEEIGGDSAACGAGFNSPQRICLMRDTGDFYEIADEIGKAIAFCADRGFKLSWDGSELLAQAQNDDDPMPDPPKDPAPAPPAKRSPAKKQSRKAAAAVPTKEPIFG